MRKKQVTFALHACRCRTSFGDLWARLGHHRSKRSNYLGMQFGEIKEVTFALCAWIAKPGCGSPLGYAEALRVAIIRYN